MSPLIDVVEDDPALRDMLGAYLQRHGLRVRTMASAEEMLGHVESGATPDLVILDLGLSGMSGLEACRQLRASRHGLPILMLSARSDEIDRVLGLEMGADDYQCKPFAARELVARVQALLRRAQPRPAAACVEGVRVGEFTFLPSARTLCRGNELRTLSRVEYAILAELCAQPGVAVSRQRLRAASHAPHDTVQDRAVDSAVMRLRRLVEPDPAEPRHIQTVRGEGYMFVPWAPAALR